MALKKVIDTMSGAAAEYWKFSGMEYRYEAGGISNFIVSFDVYVDEVKRRGNFRPLERKMVKVDTAAITPAMVDFTNVVAMGYTISKTAPELAGAEDC